MIVSGLVCQGGVSFGRARTGWSMGVLASFMFAHWGGGGHNVVVAAVSGYGTVGRKLFGVFMWTVATGDACSSGGSGAPGFGVLVGCGGGGIGTGYTRDLNREVPATRVPALSWVD